MTMPHVDLAPIMPELMLLGAAVVALIGGAVVKRAEPLALLLVSLAGVAGAAAASVVLWSWEGGPTALAGAIATDRFAVVVRLIILGAAALGLLYTYHYFERSGEHRPELYPLILLATSGMTLIAASSDLVTMFIGLEILSLALYVLTGVSSRIGSVEGAMKYFLLGAFSSAFFLYGIAMAYGATDSTHLSAVSRALAGQTGSQALALTAMAFLVVGFGFKVSAVPFHMWTPDVYQGAPTPVTAFMSAGTKVAAFGAFVRVFDVALQPLTWDWMPVLGVLAAVTVVAGSVLAIAQTDIKRMLAYSSIAHAGFILIGLTAPGNRGIAAALFYLLAYAVMTLGAFGVVMLVSSRGEEATTLSSYAGLYRRSPLLAGLMSLFLLSMAGIPPTAGFIAKVGVFRAAIGAGHWELALVGVLASVVAAFFYIRVMVLMYMQEPKGEHEPDPSFMPRLAIAIPAVITVVLGILPGLVTDLLDKASVIRW